MRDAMHTTAANERAAAAPDEGAGAAAAPDEGAGAAAAPDEGAGAAAARDDVAVYPRGRTPRAVREAQMVAAAERLFSERGYHGVSMDEIAAASGISKPMLYDYFGSKEGLLLACVERARGRLFEEIAVAVRAADEPERALRAGIEAFLSFADQQRATWVVLFGEGGRFGETAGAIRAEQSGLIAQLLRELPGWTGEPDAEQLDAVAHVFVGAAEAIAFWAVAHPEIPLERVADHLMAVLWPVVRELPSRAASGSSGRSGVSNTTVER